MQEYGISWNTMPIFQISSTISPVTGPPEINHVPKFSLEFSGMRSDPKHQPLQIL